MHQLLLATRNLHKTREFAEILGPEFDVRDLSSESELSAVEETGATFAENAILKAVAVSKYLGQEVVADDSGLEVDVLNGAPGIYSARYAGEGATDADNIAKLLADLASANKPGPFAARFRCALVLARNGNALATFEGIIEGRIVQVPRGWEGFGYDPIFEPRDFDRTFAELSSAEKNRISHRAQAIRLLRTALLARISAPT